MTPVFENLLLPARPMWTFWETAVTRRHLSPVGNYAGLVEIEKEC